MSMRSAPRRMWRSAVSLMVGCAALAALTAIAFALHTRLMVVSLVYVAVIALLSMTGEVVVALFVFVAAASLVTSLVNRGRRLAETAALQENRFREAQRIAHVGWWERDFRTNH